MLLDDSKKFLRDKGVCFRCCASVFHQAKDCDASIECAECGSECHVAALHFGPAPRESKELVSYKGQKGSKEQSPPEVHGGEPVTAPNDEQILAAKPLCTQVCGKVFRGKSCSKICLVNVYPEGRPEESKRMYVILDDQSNVSLAKTEFFDAFQTFLTTCVGVVNVTGRRAHGYMVEQLTGELSIALPTLIECNNVPNSRAEIPTPEAAYHHSYMRAMADQIPALDDAADILLMLGRDILQVHKVRLQYNGPDNAPFAQKHDLGWVIVVTSAWVEPTSLTKWKPLKHALWTMAVPVICVLVRTMSKLRRISARPFSRTALYLGLVLWSSKRTSLVQQSSKGLKRTIS